MLDHTFHVNNAEYIKWIMDNLPAGASGSAPFRISIEFLNETQPDESVSVYISNAPSLDDKNIYFKVSNNHSTAVVASLNFNS